MNNEKKTAPLCINCKHWRDKAWVNKGWGVCDNPKNETKVSGRSSIGYYLKDDPQAVKELNEFIDVRYPEDFGCIFFEPIR